MADDSDDLEGLAEIIRELAATDARRAELVAARDARMASAKADGVTWLRLQQVSGLSLRGAQLSVDRGRK